MRDRRCRALLKSAHIRLLIQKSAKLEYFQLKKYPAACICDLRESEKLKIKLIVMAELEVCSEKCLGAALKTLNSTARPKMEFSLILLSLILAHFLLIHPPSALRLAQLILIILNHLANLKNLDIWSLIILISDYPNKTF